MLDYRLGVGLIILFLFIPVHADEIFVRIRVLKTQQDLHLQAHALNIQSLNFTVNSPLNISKWQIQRRIENHQWQWQFTNLKTHKKYFSHAEQISITGDFIEVNHKYKIPSQLLLVAKGPRVDVVAQVELEKYLLGVVPNEMPLAWPEEALKAQAVASRSYTLNVIKERKHLHFDVEATVEDQVFSWLPMAQYSPHWRTKLMNVIEQTRGQYLVYDGLSIYKAYFHADSGGRTEVANNVWQKEPQQPSFSVTSSYKSSPNQFWKRTWNSAQVSKKFNRQSPLKGIHILSRTSSGRVNQLALQWQNGQQVLSGQEFRKRMGYGQLKSTWFDLQGRDGKFIFMGRGFGHGVGMCQWGAKYLAQQGKDYLEILKHYYPQTHLKNQYSEQVAKYNKLTFNNN
ncbi:MAG: SpoIID/LytB domain-containing protein [Bdellovibrionales bacterium]|nr:SpoIID/LytB domain-containing protein [Bdellovibrionales bacterium]